MVKIRPNDPRYVPSDAPAAQNPNTRLTPVIANADRARENRLIVSVHPDKIHFKLRLKMQPVVSASHERALQPANRQADEPSSEEIDEDIAAIRERLAEWDQETEQSTVLAAAPAVGLGRIAASLCTTTALTAIVLDVTGAVLGIRPSIPTNLALTATMQAASYALASGADWPSRMQASSRELCKTSFGLGLAMLVWTDKVNVPVKAMAANLIAAIYHVGSLLAPESTQPKSPSPSRFSQVTATILGRVARIDWQRGFNAIRQIDKESICRAYKACKLPADWQSRVKASSGQLYKTASDLGREAMAWMKERSRPVTTVTVNVMALINVLHNAVVHQDLAAIHTFFHVRGH